MSSHVFHRDLKAEPTLVHEGTRLGPALHRNFHLNTFLDLSSGAGSMTLGYSNLNVMRAMASQTQILPYIHSANFTAEPIESLAEWLIAEVVGDNPNSKFNGGRVIFLNSGAEAVEAACKLGMQYAIERGKGEVGDFAGFVNSYHGNTLAMLALGDHPRKRPYLGSPVEDQCLTHNLNVIRRHLADCRSLRLLPFLVMETIPGTTVGIGQPHNPQYLRDLEAAIREFDGLLVFDEVLCGNYRTGKLFAYQGSGTEPDMICLGKGLTAGYFPLSAVIVSGKVVETIMAGSGRLWHSTTNQNHPIGCAAGCAALQEYHSINFAEIEGRVFSAMVRLTENPAVQAISGTGSLRGIHLDLDNEGLHKRVRLRALQNGLAIYTEGGTIDGKGNFILFAPSYCMTEDEMLLGIELLEKSIREALNG